MAFYNENGYYYPEPQIPYDNGSGYYSYSSYPPPQSSPNYYNYLPTQSLVAYSTFNQYNHLGSTLYHSVAAPSSPDLHIEQEYEPQPYEGGYDIDQTYGKPLPPSDDICYPPSSAAAPIVAPIAAPIAAPIVAPIAAPIAAPIVAPTPKQEEAPPTTEEEEDDDDEDEDEDLRSEVEEDAAEEQQPVQSVGGEYSGNQNPHGYGLETFDLCENLFGYWPCLARMKKSCDACGNEIRGGEDVDQWTKTADYLFGNPDPYREWGADEGGYASGNRVYANHQMQYQQQQQPTSTLYQQAHQYGHNSWFP